MSCIVNIVQDADADEFNTFCDEYIHLFNRVSNYFSAKKRTSEDGDVSPSSAKVAKQEQPAPAAQPPVMSYKSKLNERIMKMRLELPTYSTIRTAGGFLSTLVLNGQGKNKEIARWYTPK